MSSSKPYEQRTDLEKIRSQWRKVTGLHTREEWSAAVVRTATAAELAANFVVRKEFQARSQFDADFVNSLLRSANGLAGKFDRLLLPLFAGSEKHETIKSLQFLAQEVNKERNAVVHQGEFRDEAEAVAIIGKAKRLIEGLVASYEDGFVLEAKGRQGR